MSLTTAYRLAIVLTKSQLRGYQRRKLMQRIFGDPRVILAFDAMLLALPAILGYFILPSFSLTGLQNNLQDLEVQGLTVIPTTIAFTMILFGVLGEISQPIQSMSTDLVNWLPISPFEYVAGSTLSVSYTYSFFLSFFLGLALGPAVRFNMLTVWGVAALMSVLSLFIGACVVELLRALTNRISSSFYKKSGRSGIFFRLVLTIVILVFVQLLFSGRIIVYVLQGLMETTRAAWFVPVIWPSLAVLAGSEENFIALTLFGILTFGFLVTLFITAAQVRAAFWVPIPVSIKLTNQTYRPTSRSMKLPGLGAVESAILRKDLRSLTRRREMARFLAIPFVLAISIGISLFPIGGVAVPEGPGFLALLFVYLMPVAIFVAIISMTSIGQEGYAVWNLYVAPITPKQVLKVKMIAPALFGFSFSAAMLAFLGFFLKISTTSLLLLLVVSLAIVLGESAMGLYFAARFPDFRETVRSRFVSVWGSLMGTFVSLLLAGLTASPILVSIMVRHSIAVEFVALSFAVGMVIFFVSWKLAEKQLSSLLREIPM